MNFGVSLRHMKSALVTGCLGVIVPVLGQDANPFPTFPSSPPASAAVRPLAVPPPRVTPPKEENAFTWDALLKETALKPGEQAAHFSFSLTNTSGAEAAITSIVTSCGCTKARVPTLPWTFAPDATGTFDVDVDTRGKSGVVTKTITVYTTAGYRYLTVRVAIPATAQMGLADRARNLQVALADRQAVFRADCAACHATPAAGKKGEALFHDVCGVCHEAAHRASMVPDLHALHKPQDRDYWRQWIRQGKDKTLMPAWAIEEGGPLIADQVESLLAYLTGAFNTAPPPARPPLPPLPVR
jgi:mono/diheme cytochrome c family protein